MKPTKQMKKKLKQQPITMTPAQLNKLKSEATEHALKVIIGFSMLAIRDEFGFGHDRLMKFHKKFFDISEAYNEGYISTHDVWSTIEKETGIQFDTEA